MMSLFVFRENPTVAYLLVLEKIAESNCSFPLTVKIFDMTLKSEEDLSLCFEICHLLMLSPTLSPPSLPLFPFILTLTPSSISE
jgi:hypothetical protein